MTPPQHFLAVLGVLLFFGLLLPQLVRPLRLPFASSLVLVGSLLGPHGLAYVAADDGLVLFGLLGATFQMLLAGIEVRTLDVDVRDRDTAKLALSNAVAPALLGVFVGRAFAYDWAASLFIGIVFFSSSMLAIFNMVRSAGAASPRASHLMNGLLVVEDAGAALFAFVLFQALQPDPRFPLPILAGLLLSSVVILRMFLPEVVTFFFRLFDERGEGEPEARLRLVVALLLLVIFAYSTVDVHPVIAAFLVGFALAEIPESSELRGRLESLGYGLFVPVFLFVVGIQTDLGVLARLDPSSALAFSILFGAIGSKLVGGLAGGRWVGLAGRDSAILAIASTAKLTVPLAATYAARDLGLLDPRLFSAIVIVSVATSILAPLALSPFLRRAESGDA